MSKIKTHRVYIKEKDEILLEFKFDINVTSKGIFTTTLNKEIVKLFQDALIELSCNLRGNYGYFESETCQGLIDLVERVSREYSSKELIEEKIILKYIIATTCTYSFSEKGDIVPNCGTDWIGNSNNSWYSGTENIHANQRNAFGLQVYVKPHFKRVYEYRSGKIKTIYEPLTAFGGSDVKGDNNFYLKWLEGLSSISVPNDGSGNLMEIEYTEEIAKVFVDMIKSICNVNERIKDFINPEQIKEIASKSIKLLN